MKTTKLIFSFLCMLAIGCVSCSASKSNDSADSIDSPASDMAEKDGAELTEADAIDLIKQANLKKKGALSSDFKAALEKFLKEYPDYAKIPFLAYGFEPDAVYVTNPDIKVREMLPDVKSGRVIVVFDFMDSDVPHMGWVSKQSDERDKLVAMDFVRENGKWVVDNFYEDVHKSMEDFINTLKSGESGGEKANLNFEE